MQKEKDIIDSTNLKKSAEEFIENFINTSMSEATFSYELKESFPGNNNALLALAKEYKIDVITKEIREEYPDYIIKSIVKTKDFKALMMFDKSPCNEYYSIEWKFTIKRKPNN